MRGLFITFEGGEGSGKTTQIQQLKNWIESNMDSVNLCLTREPGGTIEAEINSRIAVEWRGQQMAACDRSDDDVGIAP